MHGGDDARLPYPSRTLRFLITALLSAGLAFVYISVWSDFNLGASRYVHVTIERLPSFPGLLDAAKDITSGKGGVRGGKHPIDQLIRDAREEYIKVAKKEAKDVKDAAGKYRERRGRHPPPGFDAWYSYATQHGSIVVEDFFDQIYSDLEPFRGIDPPTLRLQAHAFSPRLYIRNSKVQIESNLVHPKLKVWAEMLNTLVKEKHIWIPDVDLPINIGDEPALIVPWEVIDSTSSFAHRMMPSASDITSDFAGLKDVDHPKFNFTFDPNWLGTKLPRIPGQLAPAPDRSYWSLVQPACPPRSPARTQDLMSDLWNKLGRTSEEHQPMNLLPMGLLNASGEVGGYAKSWQNSTNICQKPWLQGLHGAFLRPEDIRASQKLFPIFSGGGKLGVNSDIVLPGASEWNSTRYRAHNTESEKANWDDRESKLFWRGPATGGRNNEKNWRHFHRHRFVSMLNASHISYAERYASLDHVESIRGVDLAGTFRLQSSDPYKVQRLEGGTLAEWVGGWADASFTDLHCEFPDIKDPCPYNSKFFSLKEDVDEEDWRKYKYTAVLDGSGGDNGGEFIARLKSGNAVLRASVYRKWYDSRIQPWLHYVPIDNTLMDLYGTIEYFVGRRSRATRGGEKGRIQARRPSKNHDAEARRIAQAGKDWTDKMLRREDMLVYVYRLLLEYARLVDNARERLGWVGDLVEQN